MNTLNIFLHGKHCLLTDLACGKSKTVILRKKVKEQKKIAMYAKTVLFHYSKNSPFFSSANTVYFSGTGIWTDKSTSVLVSLSFSFFPTLPLCFGSEKSQHNKNSFACVSSSLYSFAFAVQ